MSATSEEEQDYQDDQLFELGSLLQNPELAVAKGSQADSAMQAYQIYDCTPLFGGGILRIALQTGLSPSVSQSLTSVYGKGSGKTHWTSSDASGGQRFGSPGRPSSSLHSCLPRYLP